MIKNHNRRIVISDIVILVVFVTIVFLMFLRSARSNNLYNSCLNPTDLQTIIQEETRYTFLDPQTNQSWINKISSSLLNRLSSQPFTNHLLLYFNPRYPLSINCSSCYETEECKNDQVEPFFYPKQITFSAMKILLKTNLKSSYHILLIQNPDEKNINIAYPVHSVPLFELVDHLNQYSKENPVFIIGRSYLETKIASETLVRAGFKKTYRIMTLFPNISGNKP